MESSRHRLMGSGAGSVTMMSSVIIGTPLLLLAHFPSMSLLCFASLCVAISSATCYGCPSPLAASSPTSPCPRLLRSSLSSVLIATPLPLAFPSPTHSLLLQFYPRHLCSLVHHNLHRHLFLLQRIMIIDHLASPCHHYLLHHLYRPALAFHDTGIPPPSSSASSSLPYPVKRKVLLETSLQLKRPRPNSHFLG
jgi:hypothetical protein